MKKGTTIFIFFLILVSIIGLGIAYKYRNYEMFEPDEAFFEAAINQKLGSGYRLVSIDKENSTQFLKSDINRTYKVILSSAPSVEGWKPQPRKMFEHGETLEWERIKDHTGHWGNGLMSISRIKKGSNSIMIYVYTP